MARTPRGAQGGKGAGHQPLAVSPPPPRCMQSNQVTPLSTTAQEGMRDLSLIMMHVNSRGSLESLVRQRLSRFDVRRLKVAIAAFRSADDSSTGMAPACRSD